MEETRTGAHYFQSDCIKYLKRRIAELEAARQWIPVGERLPEESGLYLIYYYDDKAYGGAWYNANIGFDCGVTHWMPLPEPPEVKE